MKLIRSPLGRIRLQAGFTSAQDAADKLAVSTVHLANIERGAARPSEVLMNRLAEIYSQDPDRLWSAWKRMRLDYLKRARKEEKAS